MLKNWQFWFAIIGAIITGLGMFYNLKAELAVQGNEIQHIKISVEEIRRNILPHFVLTPKKNNQEDL